jgi:Na+/alanine symporter
MGMRNSFPETNPVFHDQKYMYILFLNEFTLEMCLSGHTLTTDDMKHNISQPIPNFVYKDAALFAITTIMATFLPAVYTSMKIKNQPTKNQLLVD